MIQNLVKLSLENNGNISPLKISSNESGATGLTNPSILWNGKDLTINIRNVQYALYHSEFEQHFQNQWGCLAYLNPEDDVTLRTKNYLSINGSNYNLVDTNKLDTKPLWEFIGLEDARVVEWENKLFLCGVRRDTTEIGVGRMELSEIVDGKEINRYRIEPPNGYTYCEKNWMPILDMPFHFVKWTNPTEIVKVNLETLSSETILIKQQPINVARDIRGGSQVISYKNYYIAVTHEVDLWVNQKNNKDANYYHRFIVWDKDWNIVKYTEDFKFLGANIEFCCGLTKRLDKILLTFGFQDTTAFLLEMTDDFFESFLGLNSTENNSIINSFENNTLTKFVMDIENPIYNANLGMEYFNDGHFASALSFFLRSAELEQKQIINCSDSVYANLILIALCLNKIGRRKTSQKTALLNAIAYNPKRYEAYYLLSQWYEAESDYFNCYTMANICWGNYNTKNNIKVIDDLLNIREYKVLFQVAFSSWWVGKFNESRKMFFDISNRYGTTMEEHYQTLVQNNITRLGSGDKFINYTNQNELVFKFNDYDLIEKNYSQTFQDLFVLYINSGKRNGTYLEIGSADPVYGSNTKLLEEKFNWIGVGIEILPEEVEKHKTQRKNVTICADALNIDYDLLLSEMSKQFNNDGVFDYLQVDCEPPSVSFEILKKIPFHKYKFSVVTFEHDYYADITKSIRENSRKYMYDMGYVLVMGNVSMNDDCPYEDWWVHPKLINQEIINKIINNQNNCVNVGRYMIK
jgi:hypothetical protein